jgi:F-type H+-transporting ATPase subunit b
MAATENKPSGAQVLIFMVIGAILMVGGMMVANQHMLEGVEKPLTEMVGVEVSLGKTIATIGVFLILFKVIHVFYLAPLFEAIDGRSTELESTFSEAETLRAEMVAMKSDYEKRLATTEANAREQIQAQIREAQQLRDTLKAEATAQADDYKRRAIEEINAEKNKVLTDLRLHVVNLTLQATERVIGENMDNERNRKLVEDFIDKVEVPV